MKETLKYNKEIEFENNISEISSISLECTYNEDDQRASGVFQVEGSYKSFELEDEEDFRYELPFQKELDNFKENSLNIEINDFNYEINANKLIIDIDYTISYEEKDYLDEEELNRFLEEHEVDVISFKEETPPPEEEAKENEDEVRLIEEVSLEKEEIVVEEKNTENVSDVTDEIEIETKEEREEPMIVEEKQVNDEEKKEKTPEENERLIEDTLLSNINQEEKYITYHVYVCENDDTLEGISKKYNLSINEIIEYNNVEEIKGGMKLILPAKDE